MYIFASQPLCKAVAGELSCAALSSACGQCQAGGVHHEEHHTSDEAQVQKLLQILS